MPRDRKCSLVSSLSVPVPGVAEVVKTSTAGLAAGVSVAAIVLIALVAIAYYFFWDPKKSQPDRIRNVISPVSNVNGSGPQKGVASSVVKLNLQAEKNTKSKPKLTAQEKLPKHAKPTPVRPAAKVTPRPIKK